MKQGGGLRTPLPLAVILRRLRRVEVRLPPELEAKLTQCATQQGRPPADVVQEAVAHYFEEEERFIAAVQRGEAAIERGEVVTHEQVGDRLRRYLHP